MMGLKTPPKDLNYLKKILSYEDQPNNKLLKNGLEILLSTDLRYEKNIFTFEKNINDLFVLVYCNIKECKDIENMG